MQKETFQPDRGDQIAVEGSFTPGRPDGREDLKKIEDLHFLPVSFNPRDRDIQRPTIERAGG